MLGKRILSLSVVVIGVIASSHDPVFARQFFVASHVSNGGNGTIGNPWNLEYAIHWAPAIVPGDTIWVRGGTYTGHFTSALRGTPSAPIIVRAYSDERATINVPSGDPNVTMLVEGDHTWFWGLEFTSTNTETGTVNAATVFLTGNFNRFINCTFHDGTGNGISDQPSTGTQVYGCISYFNGRKTDNNNYAYGVYGQNAGARKTYSDNFFLHNFGNYQLHMYTESGRVDSFTLRHNVVASTIGASTMMFNAAPGPAGVFIDSNYFFGGGIALSLWMERKGMIDPVIRGNYFMWGYLSFRESTVGRIFTGNTVYGGLPIVTNSSGGQTNFDYTTAPQNTWLVHATNPPRPSGTRVIIRPNLYEPGRANVIVYNWSQQPNVPVDLTGLLDPGSPFVIQDAQNYYGPPVASGVYAGGEVMVPMRGLPVARPFTQPPARPVPTHTGVEFGTFVVRGLAPSTVPQIPPLTQNWSDPSLIATDDDWNGVPGIRGYRGDGLAASAGIDPRTILAPSEATPIDVQANRADPNTNAVGGIAEFDGIPDRAIALQGSAVASAPNIIVSVNTLGRQQVSVGYTLRDIDGSADNAITPVALQFRVGTSGLFRDIPAGFVADATVGPYLSGLTSTVSAILPAEADNSPVVQVRILTSWAPGANEWVAVDDITIGAAPLPVQLSSFSAQRISAGRVGLRWVTLTETNNFGFQIQRRSGETGPYADLPGGFVHGWGTSTIPHEYGFQDSAAPTGVLWYRLRQIDLDGSMHDYEGVRVDSPTSSTEEAPATFRLDQNYPNPFNPSTTISYALPTGGPVELVVSDVSGRTVATLVQEEQSRGSYQVVWDASGHASGLYFVTLKGAGSISTRKMLLLR